MKAFILLYRNVHDIQENVINMLGISSGILMECTMYVSGQTVLNPTQQNIIPIAAFWKQKSTA